MSSIFSWSPFSRTQPSASSYPETIEIRHGKQVYHLTFPPSTLSTILISDLKSLARKEAHVSPEVEIKLLFQGKRLDDKEPAGKYNIRDGSRILMTSSKKFEKPPLSESKAAVPLPTSSSKSSTPKPSPRPSTPVQQKPLSSLEKISSIRQGIKTTYGGQINTFLTNPPATRKERVETKARLSELLLQQLLKFDDVVIDPNDYGSKEARLERKAAVKWVQGLMEAIDGVDVDDVPE